jgi:light-regulated signal transduction histidine kinase (bacteriophytochrome)
MNEHVFDEMTALNNELVNTQRILVKQNKEISRLNSQLQSINADLEQFTYVVSHDLKEPLRMVTSFMELLKNKHGQDLNEKAQLYINFAIDGGRRMRNMIDDLLELSRVGREHSVKTWEPIRDIIHEVLENISTQLKDADAKVIIETELPLLPVHRSDIARLFQNLLINAVKFRRKDTPPVLVIAAEEVGDVWQFSIADNGIGIEREKFERIFEVFARLNGDENYEGSGIGLAVCKKVVNYHGGTIWIESEEGEGSTFYFTLSQSV